MLEFWKYTKHLLFPLVQQFLYLWLATAPPFFRKEQTLRCMQSYVNWGGHLTGPFRRTLSEIWILSQVRPGQHTLQGDVWRLPTWPLCLGACSCWGWLASLSLGSDKDPWSLQQGPFLLILSRISFYYSHHLKNHTDVKVYAKKPELSS